MTALTSAGPDGDISRFVGYRFPDGHYTIDPEAHRQFVEAVGGSTSERGTAHPVFGFLVAHCGMGLTFEEFMALLGAPIDAGALFGQEDLVLERPLRVGEMFTVRGSIVEARSTTGSRAGAMDLVTCGLEVVDAQGQIACRSRETYVIPRPAK
jgi:hypothetical protein